MQTHYCISIAVLPSADLPIAHPPLVVRVGPKLISWSTFEQLLISQFLNLMLDCHLLVRLSSFVSLFSLKHF